MYKSILIAFILLGFINAFAQHNNLQVDAHHSSIYYSGRVDRTQAGTVRFDWPGVGINFKFTGKEVGLHFKGGNRNYFNLYINGNLKEIIHSPGDTVLWIKNLKSNATHTVQLIKRTEGDMGQVVFYGLQLDKRAILLPYNDIPNRRIEFIGNSITCGYGTEGASKTERFKPETENNLKSYGAVLARAFNAEGRFTAHSGLGVVRNYGDKQMVSRTLTPMPGRFNRTLDTDSLPVWDFSQWQPHAVVINLGTNDFSTLPHPDKAVFQREYENLILKIRKAYGQIPVFCMVGPMTKDPCYLYVRETVETMRTLYADHHVYFIGLPDGLLNSESDWGSDWHPSYSGQRKMASQLLIPMASVLNWNYNADEIHNLNGKSLIP